MIKFILTLVLTIFGVTPPKGDAAQIVTPGIPVGTGSISGLNGEIKRLMDGWKMEKLSFPYLPNISTFEIELGYYNPLLLAFGLTSRLPGKITTTRNYNSKVQRYLLYTKLRLLKHISKPKLYWKLAFHIIRRSNAYLVGCLHMVDKNLYRTLTVKQLKRVLKGVDKIRGRLTGLSDQKVLYHRTYIPKAESFRPLGVPTKSWRVYLNMLLHPLVIQTNHVIRDYQHGFRPGRGTLTAWKSIFKDVISSPNIYEFDLKQCFPSISLPRLERRLRVIYHLPVHVARYYISLNWQPPLFRGGIKLNESQSLALWETNTKSLEVNGPPVVKYEEGLPQDSYIGIKNLGSYDTKPIERSKWAVGNEEWLMDPYGNAEEVDDPRDIHLDENDIETTEWISTIPIDILQSFLFSITDWTYNFPQSALAKTETSQLAAAIKLTFKDRYVPGRSSYSQFTHEWVKHIGTAQGSPLSPYLAALALDELQSYLPSGVKVKLYADDGILYGPGLEKMIADGNHLRMFSLIGLTINQKKSGWIKKADVWVNPLKFLGLTLEGESNLLKASTRKGSTLVFNKSDLLEAEHDIDVAVASTREALAAKLIDARSMERKYRAWREWAKRAIADNYGDYWMRLLNLSGALDGIRVFSEYYSHYDAFIWYYYVLLTRIFYMSRDAIIRTITSGVLSLRDKREVRRFITENFTPEGLEALPIAPMFDGRSQTKSGLRRLVSRIMGMFSWTHPSEEKSLVVESDPFPLYRFRSLFLIETHNPYLQNHRSKYTWVNFIKSRYAGFIMSRLYNGTYSFDDFMQDFRLKPLKGSIAWFLRNHPSLNVFTGTSFAVKKELNLLRKIQKTSTKTPSAKVRLQMKTNRSQWK